jgi:ATP-dependent DNA helicase 2 subunit 2
MVAQHCKKLKYKKTIYLVTNGNGHVDSSDFDGIAAKIKEEDIRLLVLGVDFDDPEFGFMEDNKDPQKAANEKALRKLTKDCDGVFGTMAEAISDLDVPRLKETRPVPLFKGILTLGNPEEYETAMSIDVEQYPRIMVQRPPTASSYVVRTDGGQSTQSSVTIQNGEDEPKPQDALAAVKQARTYKVEDPDAPGRKRDVDQEELEKGYEYGRTAVHVSEADRTVTDLPSNAGLDIIGFVPQDNVSRDLPRKLSAMN